MEFARCKARLYVRPRRVEKGLGVELETPGCKSLWRRASVDAHIAPDNERRRVSTKAYASKIEPDISPYCKHGPCER